MHMVQRIRLLSGLLALLVAASPALAPAAESVIENDFVKVTYQSDTDSFTAVAKRGGEVFIKEGKLLIAGGEAKVGQTTDAKWGAGQTIEVTGKEGGVATLALYQDFPFVVIKSKLIDSTDQATSVEAVDPVQLTLDLGKPAGSLKTRGTAGLTGVAENSGSFTYLAVADPETNKGVVAGWLTIDRGSGTIFSEVASDAPVFKPRLEYGGVPQGPRESFPLETLVIGYFDDARIGLEHYADALVKQYDIKLPPMPVVYCTWYHANASNAKDIARNASFAKEHLQPFGLDVFQIDDHWQEGFKGDGPRRNFWQVRPDGPYPDGMKPTADDLSAQGFTPGLWILPFSGTAENDPFWAERQDLFLTLDGKPFTVRWGGTCLDLTNPKALEYVSKTINLIIDDWNYRYLKLDGLWTGIGADIKYVQTGYKGDDNYGKPKRHDINKSPIEAYRDGMKAVREAAGDETFILGCNLSQNMRVLGASIGLFDAMRIGPDNKRDFQTLKRGPEAGSNLYFLHHRVWYNDPDPLYVTDKSDRADRRMPLTHAQLISSWVTLTGEMHSSSEAYYELGDERVDLLKRTMPSHDLMPRPVDYFENHLPSVWLLTGEVGGARRDVVGLFNWDADDAQTFKQTFSKIGMTEGKYVGFDYWGDRFVGPFEGSLTLDVPSSSCMIVATRPVGDAPALVGTSRHIAQGIVDIIDEEWDASAKALNGAGKVVAGDPYELRISALKGDGGAWKAAKADVSAEDKAAGVTVSLEPQQDWQVRAVVNSPVSRDVKWSVSFE